MTALRAKIESGARLVGTFLKTPAPQTAEILGLAGMDFAVADMEHGPIALGDLDRLCLGARSVGLPLLFRSAGLDPAAIWPALDLGCAGVMAPHVTDSASALGVIGAVKYHAGTRGFSPSGRAGGYGTVDAAEYRARMDRETIVMAQIEDRAAMANLAEIAATPDVDVLFVGPADLSLSLGCPMDAPELEEAIDAVIAAARAAGKAAGLFVGSAGQMARWEAKGVSVFVVGSDQSLLLAGARALMQGR
ncbi:MAG: aldolase [Pseudooceanicola sp.]|nr:aldolase [Pseudooceanicola sp.]